MRLLPLATLLVLYSCLTVNASQGQSSKPTLRQECTAGNLDAVVMSNATDKEYQDCLFEAVLNGHLAIVVYLKQAGKISVAKTFSPRVRPDKNAD